MKYLDFLNNSEKYLIELKDEIASVGKQLKESKENIKISSSDILSIINNYNGQEGLEKLRNFYSQVDLMLINIKFQKDKLNI